MPRRKKRYSRYDLWGKAPTVGERKVAAKAAVEKLRKEGVTPEPVSIEGRIIGRSFWGEGWCKHLESFADFAYRLERGRSYARSGSVVHLSIKPKLIESCVQGSSLYKTTVEISPLAMERWARIKTQCGGGIGSIIELLSGKISDRVMEIVCDKTEGLFPQPGEMTFNCSCPDYALMCKHVAATLYGVGHRLDSKPELLFHLRGVDPAELISAPMVLPEDAAGGPALEESNLAALFDIELDDPTAPVIVLAPTAKVVEIPFLNAEPKSNRGSSKAKAEKWSLDPPTGAMIAAMRQSRGLSVSDFAKEIRVSDATVRRWESIPGPLNIQAKPLAKLKKFRG